MVTLVVGGAASGKSEYAEHLIREAFQKAPEGISLYYLATMSAKDPESNARIQKHRARREDLPYKTWECPDMAELWAFVMGFSPKTPGIVLLDDFGNLVAGDLFSDLAEGENPSPMPPEVLEEYTREYVRIFNVLLKKCETLVLVSNNVFSDDGAATVADTGMEQYYKTLGALNQAVAAFSDEVYEVAAGVPLAVKGGGRHEANT